MAVSLCAIRDYLIRYLLYTAAVMAMTKLRVHPYRVI